MYDDMTTGRVSQRRRDTKFYSLNNDTHAYHILSQNVLPLFAIVYFSIYQ